MQGTVVPRTSRVSLPGVVTEPSLPGASPDPARSSASTMSFEPVGAPRADPRRVRSAESYTAGGVPREVAAALVNFKDEVVRVEGLRGTRAVQQARLEQLATRSKDARERLGRAMHALGRDLSGAREALEVAAAELARREIEVTDLEFQIEVLRTNLSETEGVAEADRAEAERILLDTGHDAEASRRAMGESARVIVAALRSLPGG